MMNFSRSSENRFGAFLFLALLVTSFVVMLTTQQIQIKNPRAGSTTFLATTNTAAATADTSASATINDEFSAIEHAHVPAQEAGLITVAVSMIGLLLVLIAIPVLWVNECRELKTWRLFGRAAGILVEDVPSAPVREANNDRLVCVSGRLSTRDRCTDAAFGLSIANAVRLTRHAEMYQWEQVISRVGNRITDIEYRKVWSSSYIDSSSFHVTEGHQNPKMPVTSQSFHAKTVKLGDYVVPEDLRGQVTASIVEGPKECGKVEGLHWTLRNNSLQHYQTSSRPTIGDVRITWLRAPCGEATVMAVQNKSTFAPLKTGFVVAGEDSNKVVGVGADENEECFPFSLCFGPKATAAGDRIYCLKEKTMRARQMFQMLENRSTSSFWLTRLLTWVMIVSGLFIHFSCLPDIMSYGIFSESHLQFLADFIADFGIRLITSLSFWLGTSLFYLVLSITHLRDKTSKGLVFFVASVFFFYIAANRLHMDEIIEIDSAGGKHPKHPDMLEMFGLRQDAADSVLLLEHHDEKKAHGERKHEEEHHDDKTHDKEEHHEEHRMSAEDKEDESKKEVDQMGNEIYRLGLELESLGSIYGKEALEEGPKLLKKLGATLGDAGHKVGKVAAPVVTQLGADLSDGTDNAVAQVGGDNAKTVLHTIETGVTEGASKGVDLIQEGVQEGIQIATHGMPNTTNFTLDSLGLPSMKEVKADIEPVLENLPGAVANLTQSAGAELSSLEKQAEPTVSHWVQEAKDAIKGQQKPHADEQHSTKEDHHAKHGNGASCKADDECKSGYCNPLDDACSTKPTDSL